MLVNNITFVLITNHHRTKGDTMSAQPAQKYDFEVGVYRPPSEGGSASLLLRITRNCPWNRCEFCAMYKSEKFELRTPAEVKGDIDQIADICNNLKDISGKLGDGGSITREAAIELLDSTPELNYNQGFVMVFNWLQSGAKTAFLQDANSLIMKTDQLVDILQHLRKTFPTLSRVTSYARSKTMAQKKLDELKAIRTAGLDGCISGWKPEMTNCLKMINKGVDSQGHIKGGKKAMEAGFQVSEYWMPGLGGKAMWQDHAINTARVLNEINPHYIRSRPFNPIAGTPMHKKMSTGEFSAAVGRRAIDGIKADDGKPRCHRQSLL